MSVQGSSHTDRDGGSARYVSIIGLGKQEEAIAEPDWGQSVFQVLLLCLVDPRLPSIAAVFHVLWTLLAKSWLPSTTAVHMRCDVLNLTEPT